jgi:hypothetical protein
LYWREWSFAPLVDPQEHPNVVVAMKRTNRRWRERNEIGNAFVRDGRSATSELQHQS